MPFIVDYTPAGAVGGLAYGSGKAATKSAAQAETMRFVRDLVLEQIRDKQKQQQQKEAEDRMTVSGVEGAVSDPIKLGFVVSDIRIVANKKFIAKNPAIKKFFELFTLPLGDINAQNTRMNEGEKSQKDIERHVDEWIADNTDTWNGWLEEARKAAM